MVIRPHSWNLDDRFPHRYSPFCCREMAGRHRLFSWTRTDRTSWDLWRLLQDATDIGVATDGAHPDLGDDIDSVTVATTRRQTAARLVTRGRTTSPSSDCTARFTRCLCGPRQGRRLRHNFLQYNNVEPGEGKSLARARIFAHPGFRRLVQSGRFPARSSPPSPPVQAQPHRARAPAYPPPPRVRRGATTLPAAAPSPALDG